MSSSRIRVGDLDVAGACVGSTDGRVVFELPCPMDPSTLFLLLHERIEQRVTGANADWGRLDRVHLPSWTDDGGQALIRCETQRLPSSRPAG